MTHRRLGWARFGLATVVALTVPLACGGSSSGLFNGGGSAGANSDASAGTGGSGTGGSGTGGTATGGSSTGGSSTGGSGTGGTGGTATGGTGGSGTGGTATGATGGAATGGAGGTATGATGGTATGGAGGTGTVSISCGSATCSGPSQVCCASRDSLNQTTHLDCIGAGDSCTCTGIGCMHAKISCSGPTDCPTGQVCCGTINGTSYSSVSCASSCTGYNKVEICDPGDGIACPNNAQCRQSQILTGYHYCG